MIIGSLPFVVFLTFIHGERKSLFIDDQITFIFYQLLIFLIIITTFYMACIIIIILIILLILTCVYQLFNITSILTGTGFTVVPITILGGVLDKLL